MVRRSTSFALIAVTALVLAGVGAAEPPKVVLGSKDSFVPTDMVGDSASVRGRQRRRPQRPSVEYPLDTLGPTHGSGQRNDLPRADEDAELAKGPGGIPRFAHWTLHRGRPSCLYAPRRSRGGTSQRPVQCLATVERPLEPLQALSLATRSGCISGTLAHAACWIQADMIYVRGSSSCAASRSRSSTRTSVEPAIAKPPPYVPIAADMSVLRYEQAIPFVRSRPQSASASISSLTTVSFTPATIAIYPLG
jgi:hypothetical protein